MSSEPAIEVTPAGPVFEYAPPLRRPRVGRVIAFGLLTSLATMVALHFVQRGVDTDIMSLTVRVVFPIGAMLVGVLAGLGYGLSSWIMGTQIRGWLVGVVGLLLLATFWGWHYAEFRALGPLVYKTGGRVTFPQYFHLTTTNMVWTSGSSSRDKEDETPLGMGGYFFRALGLVGFVGCGLAPILMTRKIPYCQLCSRYKRHRQLFETSATGPIPRLRVRGKIKFSDPQHAAALQDAVNKTQALYATLERGEVEAFDQQRRQFAVTRAGEKALMARLHLRFCPQCYQSTLSAKLENVGKWQFPAAGTVAETEIAPAVAERVIKLPAVKPTKLKRGATVAAATADEAAAATVEPAE